MLHARTCADAHAQAIIGEACSTLLVHALTARCTLAARGSELPSVTVAVASLTSELAERVRKLCATRVRVVRASGAYGALA